MVDLNIFESLDLHDLIRFKIKTNNLVTSASSFTTFWDIGNVSRVTKPGK